MIIFKNFFSFGLTFKAYDWLVANQTNATPVFNALGSVQLVICLSSIPLCELCRLPFYHQPSKHKTNPAARRLWQAHPQLLLPTRFARQIWPSIDPVAFSPFHVTKYSPLFITYNIVTHLNEVFFG